MASLVVSVLFESFCPIYLVLLRLPMHVASLLRTLASSFRFPFQMYAVPRRSDVTALSTNTARSEWTCMDSSERVLYCAGQWLLHLWPAGGGPLQNAFMAAASQTRKRKED